MTGWHAFVTHPGHQKVSFTISVTSQAHADRDRSARNEHDDVVIEHNDDHTATLHADELRLPRRHELPAPCCSPRRRVRHRSTVAPLTTGRRVRRRTARTRPRPVHRDGRQPIGVLGGRGSNPDSRDQSPVSCQLDDPRMSVHRGAVAPASTRSRVERRRYLPESWRLRRLSYRVGPDRRSSRRSIAEFAAAHEGIGAGVARLTALYDEHDVRGGEPRAGRRSDDRRVRGGARRDQRAAGAAAAASAPTSTVRHHRRARRRGQRVAVAAAGRSRAAAHARPPASRRGSRRLGAENLIAASQAAADHAWPLRKAERRRRPPDDRGRGRTRRRAQPHRRHRHGTGCTAT